MAYGWKSFLNLEEWSAVNGLIWGSRPCHAYDDTYLYVHGGGLGTPYTTGLWRYHFLNHTLEVMTSVGTTSGKREGVGLWTYDNWVHFLGGHSNNSTNGKDVWSYDTDTDTWDLTKIPALPGSPHGSSYPYLTQPAAGVRGTNNSIYVFGRDNFNFRCRMLSIDYDILASWTEHTLPPELDDVNLTGPHAMFWNNSSDLMFLSGRYQDPITGTDHLHLWQYDPAGPTWTLVHDQDDDEFPAISFVGEVNNNLQQGTFHFLDGLNGPWSQKYHAAFPTGVGTTWNFDTTQVINGAYGHFSGVFPSFLAPVGIGDNGEFPMAPVFHGVDIDSDDHFFSWGQIGGPRAGWGILAR